MRRARATANGPRPRDRPDPVELLEAQATSRVGQLVPLRYARMLASPFAFYRGAAAVMAADLAATPRSGFDAQLCGDAHLSNFGAFASPERELLFDVNDFDETLPGPWEWDVMRLAASFAVAGRASGFKRRERRRSSPRCRPSTGRRCGAWPSSATSRSGTRRWTCEAVARGWATAAGEKEVKTFRTQPRQDPRQGPHARPLQAHPRSRRRAAHRQRTAADRADRRAGRRDRSRHRSAGAGGSSPTIATRCPRTAASCSTATASSTRRSRWSGSAASAPAPSSCCCWGATAATHSSSRPRKPSARCSSPTRRRAPSRTRARGSSRASA